MRISLCCLLVALTVISCGGNESPNIATHEVVRTDFENAITTVGFVEPIKMTTLYCPKHIDATVEFLVEDGTFVKKGDTICILDMADIRSAKELVKLEIERVNVEFERFEINLVVQYRLMEAQVQANEAEMAMAGMDSLQLEFLNPNQRKIKELELKQARIINEKLKRKLSSLQVIQKADLDKLTLSQKRFQMQVDLAESIIASLIITSPIDGLAIRAQLRGHNRMLMEGDNVYDGMAIINIPEMKTMKVKMNIPEMDYKMVSLKDSVSYRFDAIPGMTAGGRITQKSAVGRQLTANSKVKYYDIEASLDKPETIPDPGFSATARIVLKQVRDTIVVPQIAIFDQDSIKMAYVKTKSGYEARHVETGLGSYRDVIVSRGLAVGDVIALAKPAESMITGRLLLADVAAAVNSREKKEYTYGEKVYDYCF